MSAPRQEPVPPAREAVMGADRAAEAREVTSPMPPERTQQELLAIAERALFGPIPAEPRRRTQVSARAASEESRDAGPPTFRVSIGRLEIVAPAPAAPVAPPARRADPKVSLQSYLDRRRQGRS